MGCLGRRNACIIAGASSGDPYNLTNKTCTQSFTTFDQPKEMEMGIYENAAVKRQAGFTLVELAVVMIIIGLLIGGVLKGQELIANAQITGTASAIKGIDAATTTFRDTFATMPGDMRTPNTRLPNCAAAPCATSWTTCASTRPFSWTRSAPHG